MAIRTLGERVGLLVGYTAKQSVEERPGAYAITYEQQGFESTLCLFALLGRAVRNSHVRTNPIRRRDAQAHEQGNRRDG